MAEGKRTALDVLMELASMKAGDEDSGDARGDLDDKARKASDDLFDAMQLSDEVPDEDQKAEFADKFAAAVAAVRAAAKAADGDDESREHLE